MTRHKFLPLMFLVSLLWACSPTENDVSTTATYVESTSTLFRGARLIIGDGSVIDNGAVLVEGGLIRQIGPVADVVAPPDTVVVNVEGKTLIPTLIDAHAHLGYEGYTGWGADNYSRENMINHLERYAYYGFGAVFSAGSDPDDFALNLQQQQLTGEVDGARFLFAAGMAPPGQGPNNQFLTHAMAVAENTGMTVLRGVGSPEEGRAAVRDVAAKNIGFIKIWVDDRGGSQLKLSYENYRAIIDEARSHDIKVFVHQQNALDMQDLIDAGVSGFLHGRWGAGMTSALAAQLKQADIFVVPNLGLAELRRERVANDPFLQQAVSPVVITRLGTAFDARTQATTDNPGFDADLEVGFARLLEAGVDLVLGTDAGAVPDHFFGYTGHRELEIFVRLGMSPMQALVAATGKPAEYLGLQDTGTLAVGKRADLVVLDSNPLTDIRNTRSISQVYLAGRRVEREGLARRWNLETAAQ